MKVKFPKFLIKATGDIKFSKYPLWIQYKPQLHSVKGPQVREILATVRGGDILLRRFSAYLNTVFCPGFFGHAGLYVGNNQIVHAVGQGVIQEDILNFCRCDAICVLGISPQNKFMPYSLMARETAVKEALILADKNVPYDFDFSSDNKTYYCTELVDRVYNGIFYADYSEIAGNYILTPDGIRNSKEVIMKLEIKP